MPRPGTSSGRPGSALRQPPLSALAVPVPSNTTQLQEPQQEAAAAPEPSSHRQVISSARHGQVPVVPGACPASAGLKRPASAAGQHQAATCTDALNILMWKDKLGVHITEVETVCPAVVACALQVS